MYTDKRQVVYQADAHEVLLQGDDAIDRAVSTRFDGLAELNKAHPGYFAVNAHLSPSIVNAEFERQSQALIAWFEMAPTDLSRRDHEIMAQYTMVVTRALLDLTPVKPAALRTAYLEEAKLVLTTYLRSRLLPSRQEHTATSGCHRRREVEFRHISPRNDRSVTWATAAS